MITLDVKLMDFLRWRPGDYVAVELTERGTLEVRPATTVDMRAAGPTRREPLAPIEATR